MKKFRNVPAFVTLLAGFIGSVIMILQKYTLVDFLWILVGIMLVFYIAGLLLRRLLNKAFKALEAPEEEPSKDGEQTGSEENTMDSDRNGDAKEDDGEDSNSKK